MQGLTSSIGPLILGFRITSRFRVQVLEFRF